VLNGPSPDPSAEAGLAAALVQRVIRWPEAIGIDTPGATTVEDALELKLVDQPAAKDVLRQARDLAERAV